MVDQDFDDFDGDSDSLFEGSNGFDDIDAPGGMMIGNPERSGIVGGEDNLHYGKQDFLSAHFKEAFNNFSDSASQGCARAYYFLGLMFAEGLGVAESLVQAKAQWDKGQEKGDKLCIIALLDEDEFNDIYDEDESEQAQWALENIEQDSFFGFQMAKLCSEYGCSLLDGGQLKEILERSAKEGNVLAMYELYKFYIEDGNFAKADETLLEAAKRQYPKAMVKMGEIYENGSDSHAVDEEQAIHWYSQAKAANSHLANLRLGLFYYRRNEYKSAFAYMKRAAKSGYPEAMFKLGLMYQNGWGVRAKPDTAMELLQESLKKGWREAENYLNADKQVATASSVDTLSTDPDFRNTIPAFSQVTTVEEENSTHVVEETGDSVAKKSEIRTRCESLVNTLHSQGKSQRDTAKEIVKMLIGSKNIDNWKFAPQVDSKSIADANKNFAGRNLPFDVLAILDEETRPIFKGRTGIMLTSQKLITSQGCNIFLSNIKNVAVHGKNIDVFCQDGNNYQYGLKKEVVNNAETLQDLILVLAYAARIYKS